MLTFFHVRPVPSLNHQVEQDYVIFSGLTQLNKNNRLIGDCRLQTYSISLSSIEHKNCLGRPGGTKDTQFKNLLVTSLHT